uniref:RNase H type-1 domain-containing protein n=1 Tax=Cannabis sativa TaxID=3483 RepID=A0A803P228_CANSA
MHPDKAPGPDGMGPGFYQQHWDIVGSHIVKLVTDFFDTGVFPQELNNTNLVLIPKKKNFSSMGDLRLIALCNVLYKIGSKFLANRMHNMIVLVISKTQNLGNNSSFVWRIIWQARDLVKLGARRIIGSGSTTTGEDCWPWIGESTVHFSVKSAYNLLQQSVQHQPSVDNSRFWRYGSLRSPRKSKILLGGLFQTLFPPVYSLSLSIHVAACKNGSFATEVVEAIGVKEALSWLKDKNWNKVEIETDSMLTVQVIRASHRMSYVFDLVINDCKLLLSNLPNVSLHFVRQSANRVAHYVARYSRFLSGCSIHIQNIPSDLQGLLYSEC